MNNTLVQRMITGWSAIRFVYLAMGSFIVVQSIIDHQWPATILGGYFASMAVFNYGCASGACYTGVPMVSAKSRTAPVTEEVEYEEVK